MAANSTIYKIDMQVNNMDTNYYAEHKLTIACHPSETAERLMVRLLAFALHASEALKFGNGLTDNDEADVWEKDLTGAVRLWIDVGQPEERLILKAAGKSEQVILYAYNKNPRQWWEPLAEKMKRVKNLSVMLVAPESVKSLAELADKTMSLLFSIQDGEIWVHDDHEQSVNVIVETLYPSPRD